MSSGVYIHLVSELLCGISGRLCYAQVQETEIKPEGKIALVLL